MGEEDKKIVELISLVDVNKDANGKPLFSEDAIVSWIRTISGTIKTCSTEKDLWNNFTSEEYAREDG